MTARDGTAPGPDHPRDDPEATTAIQAPPAVDLDQSFDATGLYALRSAVAAHATALGLADHHLADLILIATELATNAIRHGGGTGRLRLWRADAGLHCQISDTGPGIEDPHGVSAGPVPLHLDGGRGLWLVRQLCDQLQIITAGTGTTITAILGDAQTA
jgi:anti-sigma regulatory factor (Ser/Thr protein kinase)